MKVSEKQGTANKYEPLVFDRETEGWLFIPHTLAQRKDVTPCEKIVYAKFIKICGKRGYCTIRAKQLAEELGIDTDTLRKAFHVLIDKFFIKRLEDKNTFGTMDYRKIPDDEEDDI